jgi:hypothetical protein
MLGIAALDLTVGQPLARRGPLHRPLEALDAEAVVVAARAVADLAPYGTMEAGGR